MNHSELGKPVPVGPFLVDFATRVCTLPDGNTTHLSPTELKILLRLDTQFRTIESIAKSFAVSKYPEAMDNIDIDIASLIDKNYIAVQISALRDKIGWDNIETKRNVGYRLKPQ